MSLEESEDVVAQDDREKTRDKVNNLIKLRDGFVKIKVDAEEEGNKKENVVDKLESKGNFDFEEFF